MGDVKITIVEAKELIAADSNGKSDPYVTIALKSDLKNKKKTSYKSSTLTPKWGEAFDFSSPRVGIYHLNALACGFIALINICHTGNSNSRASFI
jgi:hypothetical protein